MNKLLLSILLFIALLVVSQAQTKVFGVVKNSTTKEVIYDLTIELQGGLINNITTTDRIGYFQFKNIPDGEYKLKIGGISYDLFEKKISVTNEKILNLGDLLITFNPKESEIGMITFSDDELLDRGNSQILQSSKDPFASISSYELGSYWFKQRGLDNKHMDIRFNGVKMNNINNGGYATFNNWGGLNDFTRRPDELVYGLESSNYAFGNLLAVANYDTRPSTMRSGTSLSYSSTNREYRNRLMLTYNTGLMDTGWAIMVSASKRWSREGMIEGTNYNSFSYYVGIEKKINQKHTLNFTSFGSPTRRALASANTQDIIDLKGIYYNSNWGWYDGKKRNEHVRKEFEPVNMLTHYWNISDKSKLFTTLSYQFGENSTSRLDWYNAYNPLPTYYKNLPSVANNAVDWLNGTISQINWTSLYDVNKNVNDGYSSFWLGSDVRKEKIYSAYTNFSTSITSFIDLVIAASYQKTKSNIFSRVDDLLGGGYVKGEESFSRSAVDLNNINLKSYEGDRYGYNYEINSDYADIYLESRLKGKLLDVKVGMKAATTKFYRDGKYKNGLFADNSFGKSKVYDFLDFGIKSNFIVKLDKKNIVQYNIMYQTIAPNSNEIFQNARINNMVVDDVKSARFFSSDFSYIYKTPRVKARLTGFYTRTKDEIQKTSGYMYLSKEKLFFSEILTGIGKEYIGGEMAIEAQILKRLTLSAVASTGKYIYKDNANYNLYFDKYSEELGEANIKDYKLSGGPQTGLSLGVEYRDRKLWWVGLFGNYLANNYIDTYRRAYNVLTENPQEINEQAKTSDQFMLNINLGKTIKLGKYSAGISLIINNILNNNKYVATGYDQIQVGRYFHGLESSYIKNLSPKLLYGMGTSYFANIYLKL